ncbi:protein phosphatase 1 regulatory subunit 37 [Paroedura picta]|uniref:protein phosphatase 1 regulatory subunit 37 n=1 Tax=Paroedura picta TaxID=143630 RepID=UPI004057555C
MRREEGALPLTDPHSTCPVMECVQVPPMQQQQQGKPAEGDHLLLLLPPDVQKEEAEAVLRAPDPWATSQEDSGPGRMEDAADFSSHLQNQNSLHTPPDPPPLESHPHGGTGGYSATKDDLQQTGAEAMEPLEPAWKETSGLSVQEDLASEAACTDASLVTAADITVRECLRDAEPSPQQNHCLQDKSDSSSQNCSLDVDTRAGGECPQDSQLDQASLSVEDGKLKPGAKHVTFPSDEDIVSGAVEPKDPWRHAQNVTVEEILTAYKQACQKLNCKQIPKLLRQIQEFKDLTPRIDCLDLKGEKLDYKTCEALEEIFKRLQFKIVDLEQTNLDEDGASALFDMIEYYESATHLNISFNKHIGTRGWQAAAHMMRKTNCLQYLDARNTPLLDHSAPFVARALRISNSLAVLHLENASLSGRPLMLLATALKMNVNLRELYLADNKLNSLQDSAQLGNLLKFNCSIQILDLRNNHILDSGLAYLCEGLKEQRKGLVTLVLWNNQLTHTGMAYMGVTLPHMQSLETLNLGHNPIGNEGVRNLKNGLIGNRSVLRLGLASTKLTCEGAVAVAEFIAESPRLLRLDLRENEIKTGGLMALSLALKVNHSLLRLDLDREPKKESVKSFIETQKALLTEIQNGCKRNFILAKEKEEKEQKLQQSASMPEITITEPLEEGRVEDGGPNGDTTPTLEEGEEVGEALMSQENGTPQKPAVDSNNESSESDSDTDEEDDEKLEMKDLTQPQKCGELECGDPPKPCSSPLKTEEALNSEIRVPLPNTTEETKCESRVGVTSAAPPQTSSPGNERRIAVSSPGRGHKIFVVTRVESLPEKSSEEKSTRQEGGPLLQADPLQPANPPAQSQLTKPDRSDGWTNETVAVLTATSETLASVPSSSLGAEKMNSGLCAGVAHGVPLPNGLRTDFAHALPDVSLGHDCKVASCAVEHELSCSKNEKELEELLLDASLEMGQEPM